MHLQSGNLAAASHHISLIAEDPTAPRSLTAINTALLAAAEGDWEKVIEGLKEVVEVEEDSTKVKEDGVEEKARYIVSCV